ncbi:DUF2637 domain-containing protein [Streptomyces sp. NPDC091279]|uniref:DUF2637 domain-containing protein n=1 Tax=Streptomyces sp. NPDC091279 TaxID=3365983 RepID=UPI00381577D0
MHESRGRHSRPEPPIPRQTSADRAQAGPSQPWYEPSRPQPWAQPGQPQPWDQPGQPQPWDHPDHPQPWGHPEQPQPWNHPGGPQPWEQPDRPQPWEQRPDQSGVWDPYAASPAWGQPGHPPAWGGPDAPLPPLDPLAHWDPAEELAYLLHDAIGNERNGAPAPTATPEPLKAARAPEAVESAEVLGVHAPDGSGGSGGSDGSGDSGESGDSGDSGDSGGGSLTGLAQITAELPPLRPAPPRRRRRSRSRSRKGEVGAVRTTSFFLAAIAAVVVSMVCVFGSMVSYAPLHHVARYRTSALAVGWWPLLVYGPWTVASLSILRAALHRRRAAHSWAVVVLFSVVAVLLCIAQAPRTPVDAGVAALPAVASLACFQQLVRQITLTRPPRRQAHPRHRTRAARKAASTNTATVTVTAKAEPATKPAV